MASLGWKGLRTTKRINRAGQIGGRCEWNTQERGEG